MKAIRIHEFGPPDVLRYEDVPDPEPAPHEIRIAVRAATVNRVLDVALRRGDQRQRNVSLPLIPGVDCAGIVDQLGPEVTRWKIGDRVAVAGRMPLEPVSENGQDYSGKTGIMGIARAGCFAERVTVPAASAFAIPQRLGFHEAAVTMRHAPTAWNLLCNIAGLQPGEWVLIMGASGNLGSVGIQIAKHVIGANVIATASSRARAHIGLELGADAAIDSSTTDLLEAVMQITGQRGINVLYDNIANPELLPKAFHALGRNGRLVTAGAHAGPNVTIDFFHLYDRKITIRGSAGYNPADVDQCFRAAAEGKITPRIAHVLPLSQAEQAHRMMEADPGMGKIVLDPTLH
jgi:NADPH:quinone reductase